MPQIESQSEFVEHSGSLRQAAWASEYATTAPAIKTVVMAKANSPRESSFISRPPSVCSM